MSAFVKLFSSILDSSIWAESSDVRVCWITLLAMADRDGVVETTAPGLARRAGVPRDVARDALAKFEAPDEDSRTTDNCGRRIARINGGYQILNYDLYRFKSDPDEAREKTAARVRRYRDRSRRRVTLGNAGNVTVTPCNAPSRPVTRGNYIADAEADAERDTIPLPPFAAPVAPDATAQQRPGPEHANGGSQPPASGAPVPSDVSVAVPAPAAATAPVVAPASVPAIDAATVHAAYISGWPVAGVAPPRISEWHPQWEQLALAISDQSRASGQEPRECLRLLLDAFWRDPFAARIGYKLTLLISEAPRLFAAAAGAEPELTPFQREMRALRTKRDKCFAVGDLAGVQRYDAESDKCAAKERRRIGRK